MLAHASELRPHSASFLPMATTSTPDGRDGRTLAISGASLPPTINNLIGLEDIIASLLRLDTRDRGDRIADI